MRSFLLLSAVVFGATTPMIARGNALDVAKPRAATPEALPPGAEVKKLELLPQTVALKGRYDYAQVVVLARLATGDTVDVTRMAHFQAPPGIATASATGKIEAVADGKGEIRIDAAGQQTVLPVDVRDCAADPHIDFIRDVNPVMTKLGCNAGTCHGAKEGKLGFKLSLRGYDPLFDVRALKDDLAARRLNVASPDDSLMLLKATAGVPHEGGQRVRTGDKYYDILRRWIADGARLDLAAPRVTKIEIAPENPVVQQIGARQQMRVVATYSDGSTRDVTAESFVDTGNQDVASVEATALVNTLRRGEAPVLARYEGAYAATTVTVMGDRTGFVWSDPPTFNRIDELVAAKWKRLKIAPSDLCSDAEFLRRVYLDLTGLPPSSTELRAFVADSSDTRAKREAVIDRLIGSADFVEHWTNKWADMLQVNSKFLGRDGAHLFRDWIKKQIEANTPYDEFVRTILTATGSNRENPPASYFKVLREPGETMENTTHLFLATRFNCNKCHDHPFERWTQDQYYHLAAFFARVDLEADPASGKAVIEGTAVEKARPLYEIVSEKAEGEVTHLRTSKVAAPEFPFPAAVADAASAAPAEKAPTRRQQLAAWMTSPDNRYFAASYVNRLWGYLTGVGIIEPLDDIRAGNPPGNPELLDYLTHEFIAHKFDVRHVLRLICQSRTYQLALHTNRWNEDDKTNYSHALPRRLPAEVLYDAVLRVVGSEPHIPGTAPGTRAQQLFDSGIDLPSGFLANLGRPARESACECERTNDLRLGSIMSLLSGPAVADAIADPKNALAALTAQESDDRKLIDEVFMRTLNRPATAQEIDRTLETWQGIGKEDASLAAALAAKEAEQAPLIAEAEKKRLEGIAAAKAELTRFEQEIAPRVAEAAKKRQAETAAAEKAVTDYQANDLAKAQAAFEQSIPAARTWTGWIPLEEFAELRASNGITLEKQADHSIHAGGGRPSTTDYVIKADTKVANITGILLEVLPDAAEASFGPGRFSDGNFVLGEFSLKTSGIDGASPADVPLTDAIADFSQNNFEVKKAIDGKRGDDNNGWAVSNSFGVPHYAAFKVNAPIGDAAKGMRLRIEMHQPRKGGFSIARFRLWITTSATPLNIGLPATVAEAMKVAPQFRSKEQQAALAAYWLENDPELRKRRLLAGKLKLPLPVDPGIVERRAAIAKAEEPIRLDPKLVQFRKDAAQSKAQLANLRLTGVQDLTWALINTPAFLFNR
jgi:hypothetical protein